MSVKWRITDANGIGVSDPATFVSITSALGGCTTGAAADELEEYASGSSGLQYEGNGYWQFNWKTPKTYAGQCRTMYLTLTNVMPDTPTSATAVFLFK